ncbi:MAG: oligosaccharide flippase family protein [Ignavibacterium sp.]|uniref:oligosaccharide flippase family protein n=1 Tax=Ignavibacterium sp. TaxID=2651167 RepID=UPI004049BA97
MLNKLKELTKDTAIYGISTMVGRFLNFILVPFFTNIFDPNEYGYVMLLYAYIGLFNIIFVYGLDSAFLKYAAFKDIGDDKDNFSTPYLSILFTSILFTAIIILLRVPIGYAISLPNNYNYLIIYSVLIIFFDSNASIPFLKLRLERKAKYFSVLKVLNITINIAANFILILKYKLGIEAIFISNLIASLLTLVFLLPTILKNFKPKMHSLLYKRLLKFGLPYLPAGLAVMMVQVIDVPILQALTDVDTVGIYKANYKLGIFMMLFVSMFQYAWQPFFLNNAKEENAKEIFSKVLTYFTVVGSVLLITLSLFISELVKINFAGFYLLGEKYWSGISIVPIILLGYFFNGLYVVFSAGIYIQEKSIFAPIVTGLGAFVNVAVNYALIPWMNIIGAALATLASYIVMAAGYYIVTQKYYHIHYEYGKILKMFFAIAVIGFLLYSSLLSSDNAILYRIILTVIYILYILFFVFDKKEFQFIKKNFLKKLNV